MNKFTFKIDLPLALPYMAYLAYMDINVFTGGHLLVLVLLALINFKFEL